MAINRTFGLEDALLRWLRPLAADQAEYAGRAAYQAPLAAAITLFLATAIAMAFRSGRAKRPPALARALLLGRLAALVMLGLVALRVLSFHTTDRLLYGGPHINRLLDPGLALTAALAGWLFARAVRYRSNAAR